jgi:hypothetical protein
MRGTSRRSVATSSTVQTRAVSFGSLRRISRCATVMLTPASAKSEAWLLRKSWNESGRTRDVVCRQFGPCTPVVSTAPPSP